MTYVMTDSHKKKIGDSVSLTRKGKPLTDSHRASLIGSHKNREKKDCPICGQHYAVNVFERHMKACKRKRHMEEQPNGQHREGGIEKLP